MVLVLLLLMMIREIMHYRQVAMLIGRMGKDTSIVEQTKPTIAESPEPYLTDEKRDELLRKELGDVQYNQLVSEQNYGNIG